MLPLSKPIERGTTLHAFPTMVPEFLLEENHYDMTVTLRARARRSWGGLLWKATPVKITAWHIIHDPDRRAIQHEAERMHREYIEWCRGIQGARLGRHI